MPTLEVLVALHVRRGGGTASIEGFGRLTRPVVVTSGILMVFQAKYYEYEIEP